MYGLWRAWKLTSKYARACAAMRHRPTAVDVVALIREQTRYLPEPPPVEGEEPDESPPLNGPAR